MPKRPSKKHRKPTGISGVNHIAHTGASAVFASELLEFTGEKAKDERIILDAFLKCEGCPIKDVKPEDIVQNPENDWDFTIAIALGDIVLELMEVAPLAAMIRGYKAAPKKHDVWDFCSSIWDNIKAKSEKYAFPKDKSLELLVYVSHWAFYPSPDCVKLLRYWCMTEQQKFSRISLHYFAGAEGCSDVLFPSPTTIADFSPDTVRTRNFINIDPKTQSNAMVARQNLPRNQGGHVIFAPQLAGDQNGVTELSFRIRNVAPNARAPSAGPKTTTGSGSESFISFSCDPVTFS